MSQSEFDDERNMELLTKIDVKVRKHAKVVEILESQKTQKRVFGEMEWSGWIFIMGD